MFARRDRRDAVKPISDIDVEDLLASARASRASHQLVDPANPIPSFKQSLDDTTEPNGQTKAAAQMGKIIEKRIMQCGDGGDLGRMAHERVLEEMRVLREQMLDLDYAAWWNEWVSGLKERLLLKGELAGLRTELWGRISSERLGLVEGNRTHVTDEEVERFLRIT